MYEINKYTDKLMLKPTLRNKNREYNVTLIVIFLSKNEMSDTCDMERLSFSPGLGELLALGCNLEKASWDNLPILEFKSLSWSFSNPPNLALLERNSGCGLLAIMVELKVPLCCCL